MAIYAVGIFFTLLAIVLSVLALVYNARILEWLVPIGAKWRA